MQGADKKLVGFQMEEKGIPRSGYDLLSNDNEVVGRVTSGSMSPSLGYGIGMGYLNADYVAPGTEIKVAVRKKTLRAKVAKPPFYKA